MPLQEKFADNRPLDSGFTFVASKKPEAFWIQERREWSEAEALACFHDFQKK